MVSFQCTRIAHSADARSMDAFIIFITDANHTGCRRAFVYALITQLRNHKSGCPKRNFSEIGRCTSWLALCKWPLAMRVVCLLVESHASNQIIYTNAEHIDSHTLGVRGRPDMASGEVVAMRVGDRNEEIGGKRNCYITKIILWHWYSQPCVVASRLVPQNVHSFIF